MGKRTGKPVGAPRTNFGCTIEGCDRPALHHQMCRMHVKRMARNGDPHLNLKAMTKEQAFHRAMPGPPPPEGTLWLWTGSIDGNGYGVISAESTKIYAHIMSYIIFNGPIPKGLHVRHTNDTPADVNPHHLILGTQTQNMQDMVERDRQARGIQIPHAVLTDDIVREARLLYAQKISYRQLAEMFNCSKTTIRSAVQGKTWKHVE